MKMLPSYFDSYFFPRTDEFYPGDTGGSLYDGHKQVLYWADVNAEVAFVVPSPDTYRPQSRRMSADSISSMGKYTHTTVKTTNHLKHKHRAFMKAFTRELKLSWQPIHCCLGNQKTNGLIC